MDAEVLDNSLDFYMFKSYHNICIQSLILKNLARLDGAGL